MKDVDIGLNSVEEYWREIVIPSVKDFSSAASPRSVFQAALALWHLHDWVWHEKNPGQSTRSAFKAYGDSLVVECPELGWLRDIADAGKHRRLGRQIPKVTVDAVPEQLLSRGSDGSGSQGSPLPVRIVVLEDGSTRDVHLLLKAATEYWRAELKPMNLPSPFA
jgi:hypothetical protein